MVGEIIPLPPSLAHKLMHKGDRVPVGAIARKLTAAGKPSAVRKLSVNN